MPDLSRRAIRRLIDVGAVYRNQKRMRVASRTVSAGDELTVYREGEDAARARPAAALQQSQILLLNDDLMVVNKPAGIPSQATRDQAVLHMEALAKAFLKEQGIANPDRLTLAHRLDKETSGVLVFARSEPYARHLFQLFKDKKVVKGYLAVCHGVPDWDVTEVRNHLSSLAEGKGMVFAVKSGGKPAVTRFRKLTGDNETGLSLILAEPLTGRSHQIRVHLSGLGHPILGDKRYVQRTGSVPADAVSAGLQRHMLHAWKLSFPARDGTSSHFFRCDPQDVMAEVLARLGFKA